MNHKELLQECKLQLEYLNEKFGETGTTNALLSKINNALSNYCECGKKGEYSAKFEMTLCDECFDKRLK